MLLGPRPTTLKSYSRVKGKGEKDPHTEGGLCGNANAAEQRGSAPATTARALPGGLAVRAVAKGAALEGDAPRGRALPPGLRVPGERGGHSALPLPGEVQWQSHRPREDHRRRHQGAISRPRPDLRQTIHRGFHAIQLRSHLVFSADLRHAISALRPNTAKSGLET